VKLGEPECVAVNVGDAVLDVVTVRVTEAEAVGLVDAVSDIDTEILMLAVLDVVFVTEDDREPVAAVDAEPVGVVESVTDTVRVGLIVTVELAETVAENEAVYVGDSVTLPVLSAEGVTVVVAVRDTVEVTEALAVTVAVSETVGVREYTSAGYTSSATTWAITSTRMTYWNRSMPGNDGAAIPRVPVSTMRAKPDTCAGVTHVTAVSDEDSTRHAEPPIVTEQPCPGQVNQKPCSVIVVPP
jgi:hypothetical protein